MFLYFAFFVACQNQPQSSEPIPASQITINGQTLDATISEIEKRSIEAIAKAEVSINPSKSQKDLEKKITKLANRISKIEDILLDLPDKLSDSAQNVGFDSFCIFFGCFVGGFYD